MDGKPPASVLTRAGYFTRLAPEANERARRGSLVVAKGFADDFRRFFLRGLAAALPAILTVSILVWLFAQVQRFFGRYITTAVQWLAVQFLSLWTRSKFDLNGADRIWDDVKGVWEAFHLEWISFVLAFVAIYILGRFVASFLGRSLWRQIDQTFLRLPVLKQVYPYVKQIVDFLLSDHKHKVALSRVVAVEYPRKGVWSLGMVTGAGMRTLQEATGGELLTVFIPSSPTPMTGYTITVGRDEVIDLPLSIDDAFRFTISGGVIMPISQQSSDAEIEQARQGILPPPEPRKESGQ